MKSVFALFAAVISLFSFCPNIGAEKFEIAGGITVNLSGGNWVNSLSPVTPSRLLNAKRDNFSITVSIDRETTEKDSLPARLEEESVNMRRQGYVMTNEINYAPLYIGSRCYYAGYKSAQGQIFSALFNHEGNTYRVIAKGMEISDFTDALYSMRNTGEQLSNAKAKESAPPAVKKVKRKKKKTLAAAREPAPAAPVPIPAPDEPASVETTASSAVIAAPAPAPAAVEPVLPAAAPSGRKYIPFAVLILLFAAWKFALYKAVKAAEKLNYLNGIDFISNSVENTKCPVIAYKITKFSRVEYVVHDKELNEYSVKLDIIKTRLFMMSVYAFFFLFSVKMALWALYPTAANSIIISALMSVSFLFSCVFGALSLVFPPKIEISNRKNGQKIYSAVLSGKNIEITDNQYVPAALLRRGNVFARNWTFTDIDNLTVSIKEQWGNMFLLRKLFGSQKGIFDLRLEMVSNAKIKGSLDVDKQTANVEIYLDPELVKFISFEKFIFAVFCVKAANYDFSLPWFR